mmetsp:Transcript_75107/g.150977  ORF Transcript_75107/g.150977 Transcript_75107/m.150977 type:complete len:335 (-) Transcript_75107:247-1251(-)
MFGSCAEPEADQRASTRDLRGAVKLPTVDSSRHKYARPPPSIRRTMSLSAGMAAAGGHGDHKESEPLRRRNSSDMMDFKRASTAIQGIRSIIFGDDSSDEESPLGRASSASSHVLKGHGGIPPPPPSTKRAFNQHEETEYEVGWMFDDESNSCMVCEQAFKPVFRWRHHCRQCGILVCSSCSPHRLPVKGLKAGNHRVCGNCYEAAMRTPALSVSAASLTNFESRPRESQTLSTNFPSVLETKGVPEKNKQEPTLPHQKGQENAKKEAAEESDLKPQKEASFSGAESGGIKEYPNHAATAAGEAALLFPVLPVWSAAGGQFQSGRTTSCSSDEP